MVWLHSECKMQGEGIAANEVQNIEMSIVGKVSNDEERMQNTTINLVGRW